MSQNSSQRKLELLSQIDDSRLSMLENAANVASRVESACSWADNVKEKITGNPAVLTGGALLGGLLVTRLVGSFFSKGSGSAPIPIPSSGGFLGNISGILLRGAGSLIMSALMPVVKDKAADLMQKPLESLLNRFSK